MSYKNLAARRENKISYGESGWTGFVKRGEENESDLERYGYHGEIPPSPPFWADMDMGLHLKTLESSPLHVLWIVLVLAGRWDHQDKPKTS